MTRALVLAALVSFACGGKSKTEPTTTTTTTTTPTTSPATASATLEARSESTATGTAELVEAGDGVQVTIKVAGATPGKHGLHFHETGDCSAPDATSAGAHWNPHQAPHAGPGTDPRHAGDLGNIEVGEDGTGTLEMTLPGMKVADIVGRAVVLHAAEDDLTSQPAGNAGARIACGVVK